jgi:hypothetical protein
VTSCGWDAEAARKDKVNSCFGPGTHVAEHEPMSGTSSNDGMFRSWLVSKRGDRAQWRVTLQWRAAENEILVKTWSERPDRRGPYQREWACQRVHGAGGHDFLGENKVVSEGKAGRHEGDTVSEGKRRTF